jgi:lactoylglutathione lyase
MISHVFIGADDLDAALAFYGPVMETLGNPLKFVDRERGWAVWTAPGGGRPFILVGRPFDGEAAPGNGHMTALLAPARAAVDAAYALALANGGTDEGPPGLRPQYHANYYGAYVRDPAGAKLCFCCHEAEPR